MEPIGWAVTWFGWLVITLFEFLFSWFGALIEAEESSTFFSFSEPDIDKLNDDILGSRSDNKLNDKNTSDLLKPNDSLTEVFYIQKEKKNELFKIKKENERKLNEKEDQSCEDEEMFRIKPLMPLKSISQESISKKAHNKKHNLIAEKLTPKFDEE